MMVNGNMVPQVFEPGMASITFREAVAEVRLTVFLQEGFGAIAG